MVQHTWYEIEQSDIILLERKIIRDFIELLKPSMKSEQLHILTNLC